MARITAADAMDPSAVGLYTDELLGIVASARNPDGTPYVVPNVERTENARLGRTFMVGSGKVSMAVAGNLRATFTNPAGSGKTVYLYSMTVLSTSLGWAELRVNPTTGLPAATVRTPTNTSIGNPGTSAVEFRVDTDTTVPLGGGSLSSSVIGLPANDVRNISLMLIIPPGVSLGIGAPFAAGFDATFNLHWWEE